MTGKLIGPNISPKFVITIVRRVRYEGLRKSTDRRGREELSIVKSNGFEPIEVIYIDPSLDIDEVAKVFDSDKIVLLSEADRKKLEEFRGKSRRNQY